MTTVALATVTAALGAAGLILETTGTLPDTITGITDDSRAVVPGALFVAVQGSTLDGHAYLPAAANAGASVAIVGRRVATALPAIVVSDVRRAASIAAAAYFGNPARAMTCIAVTGTNGKTTTVAMLRHLLDRPEARSASIGTLGVMIGSEGTPFPGGSGLTTPGPVELQRLLRALADSGVRTIAMEASSHALDQRRVDDIPFSAAVYTNFTRDHLDYHQSMSAYLAAKMRLVSLLAPDGIAIINADDRAWDALPPSARQATFGRSASAGLRADEAHFTVRGSTWTMHAADGAHRVDLPLLGDFNIENALGAAATAIALGHAPAAVARRLSILPQVPGRLERLSARPAVLRDYAHTPDALERALTAIAPFAPHGRVIVLFGCGGDRDPGKRPLMGAVAERLAHHIILTSDNPRTENPERILDDIEKGMRRHTHDRIEDRRAAIARALDIADPDRDIVLLAGKGHETYQIRGNDRLPFDEAHIVAAALAARQ